MYFMNGNTERSQCALFRVCIPKKRKRKAVKRIKNAEEGRVPKAGSRREETITEPINSCIGEFHTNSCGQIMPAVWNVAEPLEVEYRRPIHQSSNQSNSGRKGIEKPPCGEETEGQESRSRRGRQSGYPDSL